MIEMKQSFYSVASAIIFLAWGVFHGVRSVQEWNVMIGNWEMPLAMSYAIAGLMFIMAYFSLVHLKHKK